MKEKMNLFIWEKRLGILNDNAYGQVAGNIVNMRLNLAFDFILNFC